jgi:hypothetical protein
MQPAAPLQPGLQPQPVLLLHVGPAASCASNAAAHDPRQHLAPGSMTQTAQQHAAGVLLLVHVYARSSFRISRSVQQLSAEVANHMSQTRHYTAVPRLVWCTKFGANILPQQSLTKRCSTHCCSMCQHTKVYRMTVQPPTCTAAAPDRQAASAQRCRDQPRNMPCRNLQQHQTQHDSAGLYHRLNISRFTQDCCAPYYQRCSVPCRRRSVHSHTVAALYRQTC